VLEQVAAHLVAAVEDVAELLLAEEDAVEADFDARHDGEASFGGVGDRRERVDGRHFERQVGAADAGHLGGQHEQVGALRQRRQHPGEGERKGEAFGWITRLGQLQHAVLEREHGAGLDLEGKMQVEGPAAGVLGMQVDLPGLAQRVRLHEVTFVVHMELVVDGVVLQVGHEAGDVDDGQGMVLLGGWPRRADAPSLPRVGRPGYRRQSVDDDTLLSLLHDTADAIGGALGDLDDWGLAGTRVGQYRSDLAADAAALAVLESAGVGVLSEESGRHRPDAPVTVVMDPLDGSTNASRAIPWFATSLCAVDDDGARAALVVNLVSGEVFEAVRGGGATRNGQPIRPSARTVLSDSLVGLSGYPPHHLGWRQFRALGAAALDLCAVATGMLDGYLDCSWDAHGSWDYLGGMLVCVEAGASVVDAEGRDLIVLGHDDRRTPLAAGTPELLAELVTARGSFSRKG